MGTLWTHLTERCGERCEDVRHGWIQELFLDLTTFTFHSTLLSLGPWLASLLEAHGHFQNVLEHRRGTPSHLPCYQSSPPCVTAQLSLRAHSNPILDSDRLPGHSLTPEGKVGTHEWQGELPKGKETGKQNETVPPSLGPALASPADRGPT